MSEFGTELKHQKPASKPLVFFYTGCCTACVFFMQKHRKANKNAA
jgi:hypothetical protein